MQELISVIVPIYNVEKYLDRSVGALLNQTYQNLEIILVNDGSTDRSGEMCDEFARKDARVRVFHKENGGSSTARNVGIREARGSFIGFCDSDDYAELDLYENLYRIFEEYDNAVIAQAMSSNYAEDGTLISGPYRDSGKVNFIPKDEMFRMLMMHVGDSSFCTKLIRSEYMKKFLFPEGELNEDFELLLRMLDGVEGFYSLEKNGYNIELRSGSNSRNKFNRVYYDAMILNSNKAYRIMEEKYDMYREEAERFCFFQRLDYLLHIPVSAMNKENEMYHIVIKDIKKGRRMIKKNQFLSAKEKRNLLLLSYMPKLSKRCHGLIMKIKIKRGLA